MSQYLTSAPSSEDTLFKVVRRREEDGRAHWKLSGLWEAEKTPPTLRALYPPQTAAARAPRINQEDARDVGQPRSDGSSTATAAGCNYLASNPNYLRMSAHARHRKLFANTRDTYQRAVCLKKIKSGVVFYPKPFNLRYTVWGRGRSCLGWVLRRGASYKLISAFAFVHDDSCSPYAKKKGNPFRTSVKVRCCHSDKQCMTSVIRFLFGKKRDRQNCYCFATNSVRTDALRLLRMVACRMHARGQDMSVRNRKQSPKRHKSGRFWGCKKSESRPRRRC